MDYYDYYYDYSGFNEAEIMQFLEEFGLAFIGIAVVIALVALAVALMTYVLGSVGFYTIAKRRGIRNPWLAWIPVANYWLVGCISDQYQYVVKGKTKNRRKILLTLSIVSVAVNAVLQIISNATLITLFMDGSQDGMIASSAISMMSGLVSSGLNVALLVFYYIAMYDIYSSCSPQNNVLFLVLSIIFRVAEPFFVFFNRNKDGGMPPRRQEPQSYIPPVHQETWTGPEQL